MQNPQSQTSLLLEFWGVQLGGTLAWSISMSWPMERLPSSSPLLSDLVYKVCSWDFKNWPISRNPGSTNSVVCVGQKGGSTVVHPFFWILILRSVGWDIGCQSLTYPEALWLNQSGGSMFYQIGCSPVTIFFSWISIWSSLGWDIGSGKSSLRSNRKSSVAD